MGYELLFIFLVGLSIGSFINVIVDRLPNGEGIGGRSYCDACKRTLSWKELIPVVSFMIQKGRSACCRKALSPYYPLVEIVTAVTFILSWSLNGSIMSLITMSILLSIFFADLKYRIIPDILTLALIIVGIGVSVTSGVVIEYATAAFILFSIMFVIFAATRGRGMGFGDVKFAFAMGMLLGLRDGFLALYLAFILGGIVGGVLLLLARKNLKSTIAFGPFLVAGVVIAMYWSNVIWQYIQSFL